jgi:hypothetical protein
MTDPEVTADALPEPERQEVAVDETDELERPMPLEAEPADVVENRQAVEDDSDEHRVEYDF